MVSSMGATLIPYRDRTAISYLAFWATFRTVGSSSSGRSFSITNSHGIWAGRAESSNANPSCSVSWPTGM